MIFRKFHLLLDDAGDGKGAGDGAGKSQSAPDHAKDIAELKAQNAKLLERLDALSKGPQKEDGDLHLNAQKKQADDDKKKNDSKELESALMFSMKSEEFLKNNKALLPKGVEDIFLLAEKENYSSAIEKASALKTGIIQSFFSVQSNLDLLTPSQKFQVDEYLKLTKTAKQDKAQSVYDAIFEPTFEALKRVKKMEALQKGHGSPSGTEDAFKQKMIKLSNKHYLNKDT